MGLGEDLSRVTVHAYCVHSHCAHLGGVDLQDFCALRRIQEVYGVSNVVGRRSGGHRRRYCPCRLERAQGASGRRAMVLVWDSRWNRRRQNGVYLLKGGVYFPYQAYQPWRRRQARYPSRCWLVNAEDVEEHGQIRKRSPWAVLCSNVQAAYITKP